MLISTFSLCKNHLVTTLYIIPHVVLRADDCRVFSWGCQIAALGHAPRPVSGKKKAGKSKDSKDAVVAVMPALMVLPEELEAKEATAR